ncbi:Lrp/AsnC family transcriptional regulator [Roseomonas sp. GC11]|uniref:Lrp/AsnC family transcriptional regulator n=1 Tax=Roseomonas sp. GC11 TaxID=2950546 RepID=UPI00210C793E|nr:Lrp/AsnC family transcriptional regulator [Roseomonas sp. GC11]MCQ4162651.1 Lrp/AsnC family transcriptional regulator [Roseomonas sp. GC11]
MPECVTLDRFDHALLERLRVNNQTPARVLAEAVGLSESAVLRRLRALRKSGVILADVAIVHPAVLGRPLGIHVLVSLEREGTAALDAFERKLRGRPEVQGAWYVTGEADFVLHLQLGDMEEYERFTREMFHDDPNVRSFRTIITLRDALKPRR